MDNSYADNLIPLTAEQRIARAVAKLPTLSAKDVPQDDACPICLMPFSTILDGTAQNEGVSMLSGAPVKLSGVTKLEGCGHMFCRVDLVEWIRGRHGTCPACRHAFLDIAPLSESDTESEDGDYIPDDDEDDMDTEDDYDFEPDVDYEPDWDTLDEMDEDEVDADLVERSYSYLDNLGLSDGEGSDSPSEGEVAVCFDSESQSYVVDNARVYTEEDNGHAPSSSSSPASKH